MKKAIYLLMVVSAINTIYMITIEQRNEDEINRLEELIRKQNGMKVTATMYNPVVSQCDEDPLVTAGMYKINPKKASEHKWIAVSRDLLKRWGGVLDYGDKVYISGAGHKNGIYTIVDTMNKRFKNRIDFLETQGTKNYKYNNVLLAKL
jgi:3D (Asp-Asp-Asp) domain-containing protein